MTARYRLVVLDWDGTVVDSIGAIVACSRAAVAAAGLEDPGESAIRGAIGLGLGDSLRRYLPAGAGEEAYEAVLAAYRRLWIERFHIESRPFAEAVTALADLSAAGVALAVATAKSRAGLARDFARTGLAELFAASRTVDECAPKPAPEMLLSLMDELGRRPEETLMVGDSRHDLEMAAAAGVDAVAVTCGAGDPRELAARALACLPGLGSLPGWLREAAPAGCR